MKPLPYDPWKPHSITVTDIQAAANSQGVEFRQGDILLIRMGFFMVHFQLVICCLHLHRHLPPSSLFRDSNLALKLKEMLWVANQGHCGYLSVSYLHPQINQN